MSSPEPGRSARDEPALGLVRSWQLVGLAAAYGRSCGCLQLRTGRLDLPLALRVEQGVEQGASLRRSAAVSGPQPGLDWSRAFRYRKLVFRSSSAHSFRFAPSMGQQLVTQGQPSLALESALGRRRSVLPVGEILRLGSLTEALGAAPGAQGIDCDGLQTGLGEMLVPKHHW